MHQMFMPRGTAGGRMTLEVKGFFGNLPRFIFVGAIDRYVFASPSVGFGRLKNRS